VIEPARVDRDCIPAMERVGRLLRRLIFGNALCATKTRTKRVAETISAGISSCAEAKSEEEGEGYFHRIWPTRMPFSVRKSNRFTALSATAAEDSGGDSLFAPQGDDDFLVASTENDAAVFDTLNAELVGLCAQTKTELLTFDHGWPRG
jgi:hypothetical protein